MRKLILLIFILFFVVSLSKAQDIQFPPSIVAAGGGVNNNNSDHVSKWRIGRVNVIYINSDNLKSMAAIGVTKNIEEEHGGWKILAYPNPVVDFLQIEFRIEKPIQFRIEVTDISGRKLILQKAQLIYPNETLELDLSSLSSALYIVDIKSADFSINKILKISKQ